MQQRTHVLPARKRAGKDVRRGDGILNREVDADPTNRRHGVCRVADREKACPMPGGEPVELHAEKVEIGDLVELSQVKLCGSGRCDFFPDRLDSARLVSLGGPLRDDEGALPIIATVDHHEDAPAIDIAAKACRPLPALAQTEPEYVYRRTQVLKGKDLPGDRRAAVRCDGQRSAQL